MDEAEMRKYFEVYSTDYEAAVDTYYTEGIVFEYAGKKYVGKEDVLGYFRSIRVNWHLLSTSGWAHQPCQDLPVLRVVPV